MSEFPINVKVSELRQIADVLFTRLEELGYSHVRINESYYWHIPTEEKYVVEKDPKDLNIGDLVHDWERMEQILADREMAVTDALIWFGSILRAVGETTEG